MQRKQHKLQFTWRRSPSFLRKALCEVLAAVLVFSGQGSLSFSSRVLTLSVTTLASLIIEKRAEASSTPQPGMQGQGDGMGNQQNPGDQGGGGAADFLFGIAAIIAAIAPMIVAGIESEKEQKIAKIEADTQITQAEIQTSTQKELANLSSQTALKQAEASREVAIMNNEAQTQRLQINLAFAQQQRNEERQDQQAQLEIQRQAQAQQIALAERQAEEAKELVRKNNEAQSLQVALAGGTGASPSASQSLTPVNPLASSLLGAGATASAASSSSSKPASSVGLNSSAPSAVLSGNLPMARGLFEESESGVKKDQSTSSRLLASVDTSITSLESVDGLQTILKRTSKNKGFGIPRIALNGKRGLVAKPLRNGRGLYANGSDPRVGGSYPDGLKKRAVLLDFAPRAETKPALLGERIKKSQNPLGSTH